MTEVTTAVSNGTDTITITFEDQDNPSGGTFTVTGGATQATVTTVTTGKIRVVPRRRILCSVQCCGAGAMQALSQAQDRLEIPSLYETWFVDREMEAHTGQLRNLTGMKNGRYEQRAQIDVIINCINSDDGDGTQFVDDLGWFDTVTYSAEIDGNNSETLILTDKSIEGA